MLFNFISFQKYELQDVTNSMYDMNIMQYTKNSVLCEYAKKQLVQNIPKYVLNIPHNILLSVNQIEINPTVTHFFHELHNIRVGIFNTYFGMFCTSCFLAYSHNTLFLVYCIIFISYIIFVTSCSSYFCKEIKLNSNQC